MRATILRWAAGAALLAAAGTACAGPYSAGLGDGAKADAPIPGFTGPDGDGLARLPDGFEGYIHERNYVNPLFTGWAFAIADYAPTAEAAPGWQTPELTLGPVTGDHFHVASLGDLASGGTPGTITLVFDPPIRDLTGADFAVFENGFPSDFPTGGSGIGGIFADLAYVEVSADGEDYFRFPATSLTAAPVGDYGTIDPTAVHNLAGKHLNAGGDTWGTPFDLAQLGLPAITHIRLVDVPGSGTALDHTGHPIYDAWPTTGSGGADLEALGAIAQLTTFPTWLPLENLAPAQRPALADPDGDSLPNLLEYAFTRLPHLPDTAPSVLLETVADTLTLTFTRDERATDLTYEIQAATTAAGPWATLARSLAGGPCLPVAPYLPAITETSASPIASIGVIRKVRLTDIQTLTASTARVLRVKVTQISP